MSEAYIERQVEKILLHNRIHVIIQKIKHEEALNNTQAPKMELEQVQTKIEVAQLPQQPNLSQPGVGLQQGEVQPDQHFFKPIEKPQEIVVPSPKGEQEIQDKGQNKQL